MTPLLFCENEVDPNVVKRLDMYIKQTCNNTFKNQLKVEQKGKRVVSVPIYDFENLLEYTEKGFEEIEFEEIEVLGYKIRISNYKLLNGIKSVPENLRVTLVLNVVVKIPMKDIALLLGVTERTVKNYKAYAIEKIRRYMDNNEE